VFGIDNLSEEQMHKSGHTMLKIALSLLTLLSGIVVTYIYWSGSTLYSLGQAMPVLAERMNTYNNEVTALRSDLKDFTQNQYTKAQAEADKRLIWREFEIINKRIDGLE